MLQKALHLYLLRYFEVQAFQVRRVAFQGRASGAATITPVLATLPLLLLLLINSVL